MNRPKPRALIVLACAALCGGLMAACGDADDDPGQSSAATTLEQTFAATSKLDSGRLNGRLQLDPDGLLALGGPIVLSASGPFAAPARDAGPRFDIAIGAAIAGQSFKAGASSTGRKAFLRLDGRDYALGDFGAHDKPHRTARSKRGALASLGLDPAAWIADPKTGPGHATIDGVETTSVTGSLDVERMLADLAKLLGGGEPGGGLLTPKLRRQIVDAVKSATVAIASGADDKILRRLTAAIDFKFPENATPPITGLDGGRIHLSLNLADVNATSVEVTAPKRARPLSQLLGEGGLGAFLRGLGASLGGGASGKGDGGAAFLQCITAAGGETAEVMRCASKLAP